MTRTNITKSDLLAIAAQTGLTDMEACRRIAECRIKEGRCPACSALEFHAPRCPREIRRCDAMVAEAEAAHIYLDSLNVARSEFDETDAPKALTLEQRIALAVHDAAAVARAAALEEQA